MSCCFISFVTCPEIAGIETALHFSDCSSRSCGHRNAGCLPRLFPLLSRLPVYLSLKSSLVSSPPCLPFFLSLSLPWGDDSGSSGKSLINTETLFYFFNKNAVAFLSLSSSLLFLAFNTLLRFSKHQTSGGCSVWLKRRGPDKTLCCTKIGGDDTLYPPWAGLMHNMALNPVK